MKFNNPSVIVGNSLSAMIAANQIAKNGIPVILINGSTNWGGHFSAITIKDVSYDAGMVLHEFTAYNTQALDGELSSYNPSMRNDSGRFCNLIRNFVNSYQETHDIHSIKMSVGNVICDDILISNQLDRIKLLPKAPQIANELLSICNSPQTNYLHPKNKHNSDIYHNATYAETSIANHGKTFHDLIIEPYCKKLLNMPSTEVAAIYHRVPWLPIFYPETLLSYFSDSPQSLPPTIFSYPTRECIGQISNKILFEIKSQPNIKIINKFPKSISTINNDRFSIKFHGEESINCTSLAWSGSPSDLIKSLGNFTHNLDYDRSSFALAFIRIPANSIKIDFTVLSIIQPEFCTYRITNQTRCTLIDEPYNRIVVELNIDYFKSMTNGTPNPSINRTIIDELVNIGLVHDSKAIDILNVVELKSALSKPSFDNIKNFNEEIKIINDLAPNIELLGPSSGFSSSSFNHQVLQGLKLCHTWSK